MKTQQAVEKTKERIKAELDQVYWRGCTDGNEGGGWEIGFTEKDNPLVAILSLIDEEKDSLLDKITDGVLSIIDQNSNLHPSVMKSKVIELAEALITNHLEEKV